jgi:hypothetical protein
MPEGSSSLRGDRGSARASTLIEQLPPASLLLLPTRARVFIENRNQVRKKVT